jgi:hypothetical protein
MSKVPNWKLYKECPKCGTLAFGQYDVFCSRCGSKLKDGNEWLASIRDYAKTLLIDYLKNSPGLALAVSISEIPSNATEGIRANGNVMFNQAATRHILAECWNEVEIALDDWREKDGANYPINNIEQLHVFSVSQHAEMVWREMMSDYHADQLDNESIADAIERLQNW